MAKNGDELERRFEELVKMARGNNGKVDEELIRRAWEFAKLAHVDQKRVSGESVLKHTLAVAEIIAGWKLDTASIVAGILHDTVDEGGAKQEDLIVEFGEEIADLVAGEVKVAGIRLTRIREEEWVENLRQMVLSMARDLRVVLLKIASRLHSLETLSVLSREEQERIGRETLEDICAAGGAVGDGGSEGDVGGFGFSLCISCRVGRGGEGG